MLSEFLNKTLEIWPTPDVNAFVFQQIGKRGPLVINPHEHDRLLLSIGALNLPELPRSRCGILRNQSHYTGAPTNPGTTFALPIFAPRFFDRHVCKFEGGAFQLCLGAKKCAVFRIFYGEGCKNALAHCMLLWPNVTVPGTAPMSRSKNDALVAAVMFPLSARPYRGSERPTPFNRLTTSMETRVGVYRTYPWHFS